ncbi:glycosyltransferase [Rhodococcus gordoniae]|uniref:glycosyltransferase n=1 Tax=Rhodococcus gordoniae TaxID=223392 RepID=UPI0020CEEBE5|nr:glycosyltransferase [Rhodococcus gordoniae]UTT48043.1 glycosyltransferase [Rhodococcus gordoniae]
MDKSVGIIGTRGYPSYYGGFETMVRELAPYLADRGWDVTVYGRPGAIKADDSRRDERIRSLVTPGLETKSLSTLSYGLSSAVHSAATRPDVALVLNVANGYWLPLLKARNIPTLVNVDGIEWERAKWGRTAKFAFRAGARLTAKYADDLVFDSHAIGDRWAKEFDRKGQFIPYGAHAPASIPPPDNLKPGKYILIVARFVPENTVAEFFSAAKILSRDWDVVIVGSSGYGGELDDHAQHLSESVERIHWFGHISDDAKLFALWQNAGVYFHGHSVGGTNPALVQAMACGIPIIARDTVFNREVLGPDGEFFQPYPEDIVRSVSAVMADPSKRALLGATALARQKAEYTWAGVCSSYHDALEGLRTQ